MRRLGLLLLFATMLLTTAPASAHQIGVIGGLNLANLDVDPEGGIEYDNRAGVGIGGVIDFALDENVGLVFEPMYVQKGSKAKFGSQESTIKLAYFSVPMLFRIAFGSASARPYFVGGGDIGAKVSAKLEEDSQETDIKDEIKGVDFGATFGGGVTFPVGGNSAFIETRYTAGLNDINDISGDPTEVKTRGLQVFGGFTFPLGS